MSKEFHETRTRFRSGALTKHEYIEQMHRWHSLLFAYAEILPETEIGSIEITDGRVILTTRSGVRFLGDPLDRRHSPIEALNFGRYEKQDAEMLWQLLPSEGVVFDIGANVGWYALHIATARPRTRVLAFEPVPETFANLQANARLNHLGNLTLFNHGLSEREETQRFFFSAEATGAASAVNLTDTATTRQVDVRVRRLDDVTRELGFGPDFIKCDVEGAELFVFRGGTRSLERFTPIVFCEMLRKWACKFGYHPNDLIELLAPLGYGCYAVADGGLRPLLAVQEDTAATNFFFLHRDRHEAQIERLAAHPAATPLQQ